MQRCRGLIEESEADGLPGSDGTMVLPSSWLVCSRLDVTLFLPVTWLKAFPGLILVREREKKNKGVFVSVSQNFLSPDGF